MEKMILYRHLCLVYVSAIKSPRVLAGMKSGCSNNVLDHVHLFVGIPQIPQISCNGFRSLNSETKWSFQTCVCSKTRV